MVAGWCCSRLRGHVSLLELVPQSAVATELGCSAMEEGIVEMEWEFVPFAGITSQAISITLGQSRDLLRKHAASVFSPLEPNAAYPDEDDFMTLDGVTFIRVRYQDDTVRDIEFLSGKLRYKGVELHDQATLKTVRRFLQSENHLLRRTKWLGDGFDCVSLGINIACHDDIGGDGDGIEWVILSRNFKDSE